VHAAIDKAESVFFRCTMDGSEASPWLEIPAWMFERAAHLDELPLTAEPFVTAKAT